MMLIKLNVLISMIFTFLVKVLYKRIYLEVGTIIYWRSSVVTISSGKIKIGKNCLIGRGKRGYHAGLPFYTSILSDGDDSKVIIGDNCRINGAYIHARKEITIGNNCLFASGVQIIDTNGHEIESTNRTITTDTPAPISIGNNVWCCLNSVILKGTTIGDNSIVAANSVVKGTFPSNSVIQGNPAKVIKTLPL